MQGSPLAAAAMLALAAWLLMGCAVTDTFDAEGSRTSRSWSLGPARFPQDRGETAYIRQRGLGLASGGGFTAIGYYDHGFARASGPCGSVIVLEDAAAVVRARELLPRIGRITMTEL